MRKELASFIQVCGLAFSSSGEEDDLMKSIGNAEFDAENDEGCWNMHDYGYFSDEERERWDCCKGLGRAEEVCRVGWHKELNDEETDRDRYERSDDEEDEEDEE